MNLDHNVDIPAASMLVLKENKERYINGEISAWMLALKAGLNLSEAAPVLEEYDKEAGR